MSLARPIYVETTIYTDMEQLWTYTQDPHIHQQWDLRFSSIEYLPKEKESEPQRFLYTTNIGFGLAIAGEGESVKTVTKESGERISSLKFWTDHPFSLIKEGSGYWKYIPTENGIKFFTQYDYTNRFGTLGRLFDRMVFRPLLGWATAWSFDCLKLWLEKSIHPTISILRSAIQLIVCLTLAFIFMYQGLVPKLLFPHSGELDIIKGLGLFQGFEQFVLSALGVAEILFGIAFLIWSKKKWLYGGTILLLLGLVGSALISDVGLFIAPFNPGTLTIAMIGLTVIGYLNTKDLPSAAHCKRKR